MEIITVSDGEEFYEKSKKTPYLTAIVQVSEKLYSPIITIQKGLQTIDPRQLYCPTDYLHITLKTIGSLGGSIDENKLPKIIGAIEKVAKGKRGFYVEFGRLGIFPDVIYLEIKRGAGELRQLHLSLINQLHGLAILGRFEGPQMIPHVTLLTFATRDVEPLLEKAKSIRGLKVPSMKVGSIQLIKSYQYRLLSAGKESAPINEEVISFPLS